MEYQESTCTDLLEDYDRGHSADGYSNVDSGSWHSGSKVEVGRMVEGVRLNVTWFSSIAGQSSYVAPLRPDHGPAVEKCYYLVCMWNLKNSVRVRGSSPTCSEGMEIKSND